jgi:hypothetical protein
LLDSTENAQVASLYATAGAGRPSRELPNADWQLPIEKETQRHQVLKSAIGNRKSEITT